MTNNEAGAMRNIALAARLLRTIVLLVQRPYSTAELAARHGVDQSTAWRDIGRLERLGVPILHIEDEWGIAEGEFKARAQRFIAAMLE